MRVVVLGAGFGGLELTATLAERFAGRLDLVLIDQADGFVFGFSKLDVMFGRADPSRVVHRYADLVQPGVTFLNATVTAIDPAIRSVTTDQGEVTGDVLVIALGADLHPELTPGLREHGHEFYTVPGAFALRDILREFAGGRVVVGVTSTPFKCPPAPSETALLLHDLLATRGPSEISLVMPMGSPIPPSPEASQAVLSAFAERGIAWHPNALVREVLPGRAVLADDSELPFDLFLGVPVHRAPQVVVDAGLTVDGWVQVDPLSLATTYQNVFAVGDVTSIGTPKAGVFAEGQAAVVARRIAAIVRGEEPRETYDGHGLCYLELGHDEVAKVDVTFRPGAAPEGSLIGPSRELVADKQSFGTTRISRWFGHS